MANVLGHQDNWLFLEELEQLAQINVKMDNRANDHLQQVLALDMIPRCHPTIAYKGWQWYMMDCKVTSNPVPAIWHAVFGVQLRDKVIHDKQIPNAWSHNFTWKAIKDLFPPIPPLGCKHVSRFFRLGHMMAKQVGAFLGPQLMSLL